ncbi:MAG: hypothetical protein ACNS63_03650 [Candidatus Nitrospinota bacterium M3_3B_026]
MENDRVWRLWARWLLTAALLMIAGAVLMVARDGNFSYFGAHPGFVQYARGIQLPWFQYAIEPGQEVTVRTKVAGKLPAGAMALELFGHAAGGHAPGHVVINGKTYPLSSGKYPAWHAFPLEDPPSSWDGNITFTYKNDDPGGRLTIWGSLIPPAAAPAGEARPPLIRLPDGSLEPLKTRTSVPAPVSIRGESSGEIIAADKEGGVEKTAAQVWAETFQGYPWDLFWRVSVKTGLVSWKAVGKGLFLAGFLVALGLTGFLAWRGLRERPYATVALLALFIATLSLRLCMLQNYESSPAGTWFDMELRDTLWWDSATYHTAAMNAYSNWDYPGARRTPVGYPAMNTVLHFFFGAHPFPAKVAHVFMHTLIGLLLVALCYNLTKSRVVAALSVLFWTVFLRPMPYQVFSLTETLAMTFLFLSVFFAFFRWRRDTIPYQILLSAACYAVACYARDITIIYLPLMALAWLMKAEGSWPRRAGQAALALALVFIIWLPYGIYKSKGELGEFADFVPITELRYADAKKNYIYSGRDYSNYGTVAFLAAAVADNAAIIMSQPVAQVEKLAESIKKWWIGEWGVGGRIRMVKNTFLENARLEVNQERFYRILLIGIFLAAPLLLYRGPKEIWWTTLFFYFMAIFHFYFFPGHFSARWKAIYFPLVVFGGFFAWSEMARRLYSLVRRFFMKEPKAA